MAAPLAKKVAVLSVDSGLQRLSDLKVCPATLSFADLDDDSGACWELFKAVSAGQQGGWVNYAECHAYALMDVIQDKGDSDSISSCLVFNVLHQEYEVYFFVP